MLRRLFFIILLASHKFLSAQVAADTLPPYKQFPDIPPFTLITAPDSMSFTKAQLVKGKETIIMVFSPDCDHCIHATEALRKHIDLFKNVQIVMATVLDYSHVIKFYEDMNLAAYPNIKAGTDKGYFLGTFFHVRSLPAIFLYDEKGKLKAEFDLALWPKIAEAL